jgi:hypothetical protein
MRLDANDALVLAGSADHGVLCTLNAAGEIDAVPACFVLDGELIAVPIDRIKPKASGELQRVRNLERHPEATFLCERWDAVDWTRLWWVRLRVTRSEAPIEVIERLTAALRAKYPQYESAPFAAILTFRVRAVSGWAARPTER